MKARRFLTRLLMVCLMVVMLATTAYAAKDELATPKISSATTEKSSGKPKIKWNKVKYAEEYVIYRRKSSDDGYDKIATTESTSYTDKSAKVGTKYYYKVRAVDEDDKYADSDRSDPKAITCDLAQPEVTVKAKSVSSVKVSWKKVSGTSKYYVYRATSKSGEYKKVKTTTSTSFTDKDVKIGKTYYYKVKAAHSKSAANSAYSDIESVKVKLAAPEMETKATVTKNSIKISWEKVSGASGYYVYSRKDSSDSWDKIKTISSSSTTSFTDKDISGKYYYSVIAYKKVGDTKYTGSRSEAIRARTLSNIKSVDADGGDADFTNVITWQKVSGATGYQVYYKAGKDGSWEKAATLDNVTSYTHEGVDHGIYYYYKVRPTYKSNGVTSYGKYTEGDEGRIWYYNPNVSIWMSSSYDSSASVTIIRVTNNGVAPIYFYSDGGRWVDKDYYSYDRDIVLYDYDAYEAGYLEETDKVRVDPGESTWLLVGVVGEDTWYDQYTTIYLDAYYDGIYYRTYSSSYYGFGYYKK